MYIDRRLTEINIFKLIHDIGTLFDYITDEEITDCIQQNVLLTPNSIYNASEDTYSYKHDKTFDLLKISTIANEINKGTYNYNYPIIIWEDDDGEITYNADDAELYHIRAFYYCKTNMYVSIHKID